MPKIDENMFRKMSEIKEKGIDPYPYTFDRTHHAADIQKKHAKLKPEEKTKDKVSVAGRILFKRIMGKASFLHIQDESGRMQLYLTQDNLGKEQYKLLTKKIDIGDIIGVAGIIFKTRMGEVTVEADSAQILCKSLMMLPEKFHGLKDIELKYRQRYVDLIVTPETKVVFQKRSRMIEIIRKFFHEKGFMEVETPALQTIYGGANARPFETHINAWDMKMFLSISPELYLKRLLVGGFEKVFTICKNFRNEDVDPSHNPEFTMLEIYEAYVDYERMMEYLEQIYEKSCIAINGTTKVKQTYKGEPVTLDFKTPWKRLSMIDAIQKYADIDVSKMSEKQIRKVVEKHNIEYEGKFTWGLGVQLLFEELAEDKLIQPVHIIDHPKETTPLCKPKRGDPRLIERFESFCMGMELCNAYSELNDPVLQRKLLEDQAEELRAGAEEAHPMDEDFVNAMEYGMPPAGGLGFGIDRMAVILIGVDSIRDVILFPTVKPIEEAAPVEKKIKTRKLFTRDHYCKEFDAKILCVEKNQVILDRTCFYPEGGGQVGDTGKLNEETVIDTQKVKGNVVHILARDAPFELGENVHGTLDWERRHNVMRLHSASHIMEHFLFKIFGKLKLTNTFVNDNSDVSTYSFDGDEKQVKKVEELANEFINGNKKIKMVEDEKRAGFMWWTCGEIKEGCGGTHVRNTEEIGEIEIKGKKEGNSLVVVTKLK